MGMFLNSLEEAKEFSLETDLERLGEKGITKEILESFDLLMNAKNTDELKDVPDDIIFGITRYSEKLTKLYKQQRFLTETTLNNLKSMRGVCVRRVL